MKKSKFFFWIFTALLLSQYLYSQYPQTNFCRHGLNIPIPDLGSARDSVLVNLTGAQEILDVNVIIDTLLHTWVSDLNFFVRKENINVNIINHIGGSGDNFIGTILDDSAQPPPPPPPFTGRVRPFQPLTPFNGQPTNGSWILTISDDVQGDSGILKAWCIQLVHRVPPLGGINTSEIPNSYRLYQNHPNPFNPVTTIKFGLPENSQVKLIIYDVLGNETAVLVNEYREANSYEVKWDAGNFSSGIYFYKLEAKDFAATKKMLFVK